MSGDFHYMAVEVAYGTRLDDMVLQFVLTNLPWAVLVSVNGGRSGGMSGGEFLFRVPDVPNELCAN
jgi:hypothetical protein